MIHSWRSGCVERGWACVLDLGELVDGWQGGFEDWLWTGVGIDEYSEAGRE